MKELLELILSKTLPEGTEFNVAETSSEDASTVTFNITLPDELKGRIIGKQGRNINAIRQIMNVMAKQTDKRVLVEIVD